MKPRMRIDLSNIKEEDIIKIQGDPMESLIKDLEDEGIPKAQFISLFKVKKQQNKHQEYKKIKEPSLLGVILSSSKKEFVKDGIPYKKSAYIKKYMSDTQKKNVLIDKWQKLMAHIGVYNVVKEILTIDDVRVKSYGVDAKVYGVTGLPITELEKYVDKIEGEFNCKFMINYDYTNKEYCEVTFLGTNLNYNAWAFEPYKSKPFELYWGVDERGLPVISNVNKAPHTLIAGQTGKGKNGGLDHALLSLVVNANPKEAQLILLEGAKSDLIKYAFSPHTLAYLTDYVDMGKIMGWVYQELKRRVKLFMPMLINIKGDNLEDYNNLAKKANKETLPYIYVVVDEFIGLMINESSKADAESEAKEKVIAVLSKMAQMGRSVGIVFIVCHQKPEKALMPTFLKNMTSTRICFGFDDQICSQIVLGNNNAHKLPQRRAAMYTDGQPEKMIFTTDLRQDMDNLVFSTRTKVHNPPLQAKILGKDSFRQTVGDSALVDFSKVDRNKDINPLVGFNNVIELPLEKDKFNMYPISKEEVERLRYHRKAMREAGASNTTSNKMSSNAINNNLDLSNLFDEMAYEEHYLDNSTDE